MDRYFPPITREQLWPFKIVRELLKDDPRALDDANCPYDPEVKAFFLEKTASGEAKTEKKSWDDLENEIQDLMAGLDKFWDTLKPDDTTEQMQYFRTKTQLIEKLVALRERATNIKEVGEFQKKVLDFIEEVLEPGQRTAFMQRMAQWVRA